MGRLQLAQRLGKTGLKNWTSLFLQQGCPVCDRPTSQTFCPDCQRQLSSDLTAGGRSVQGWYRNESHPLPVSALGIYSGPLKRAILAIKYSDRPDVAIPLGSALGQQWHHQPHPTTRYPRLYAVPIPLHADRLATRGYNQAELIARAFCQSSGLPMLAAGLNRTQATQPQHQLSLSARQQNLAQAFRVGPSLNRMLDSSPSQRQCRPAAVLIDDIYTTGTTARSAADTLARAGMPVIGILAVARAVL